MNSITTSFVDDETPGDTRDGSNVAFARAQTRILRAAWSYSATAFQQAGSDFTLRGNSITFSSNSGPQAADILLANDRVSGTAQSTTRMDGKTPSRTMDGVNTAYTLANVTASALRLDQNGAPPS